MDEFARMNGQTSTAYHPPLCTSGTAMDWANYFNTYADSSFQGATPIVPDWENYFTDTDQLTCNPSGSNSGGGGETYNWGQYVEDLQDFWACVEESELPFPFECDGILGGFGGVVLSSIENDSINVRLKNANPDGSGGAYYLTSPATLPKIEKGLYHFTVYLRDGNAIPTVIELHKQVDETRPLKELAKLDLIPNPIENNTVAFAVRSAVRMPKFIRVHDLYGNPVYSEDASGQEIARAVDVSAYSSPAFIVSVVFQDGSILQKTAVK